MSRSSGTEEIREKHEDQKDETSEMKFISTTGLFQHFTATVLLLCLCNKKNYYNTQTKSLPNKN